VIGIGFYIVFQVIWVTFTRKAQLSQQFLEGMFMGAEVQNA